jgi:hypothetical protein
MLRWLTLCFWAANFICLLGAHPVPTMQEPGIQFVFKGRAYQLQYKMQIGALTFGLHPNCNNACLDTLCNRLINNRHYIEIIRQDDPVHPKMGLALGFEFDEENGTYPYTPSYAVAQLKDFSWGGVEFSKRDTFNYTGLSNNVSDDLTVELDSFIHDTIYDRFSGLLLSGGGPMATVDSGSFKVKLYRQD